VLDLLGPLAKPGDSVEINGHRLTVRRADPTRIRKIRIEPLGAEQGAPQESVSRVQMVRVLADIAA